MITIDEMTIYCLYLWYFIPPIRFCTAPISPLKSNQTLTYHVQHLPLYGLDFHSLSRQAGVYVASYTRIFQTAYSMTISAYDIVRS